MYDVNYFISKFEAIPEDRWCIFDLYSSGKSCAFGHCGTVKQSGQYLHTNEGEALRKLFSSIDTFVTAVNDDNHFRYNQPTSKQRILAALYDIKALSDKDGMMPTETSAGIEVKTKEVIRYVSVPLSITEQHKDLVLS